MTEPNWNPNSQRNYKLKRPVRSFFCALCRVPRQTRYHRFLSPFQYLQVAVTSGVSVWLLWPLFGAKGFFIPIIIWSAFELTNKSLYRKELPCPNCGFDPTWYRKDVKVARAKVAETIQASEVGQTTDLETEESQLEKPFDRQDAV